MIGINIKKKNSELENFFSKILLFSKNLKLLPRRFKFFPNFHEL